MRRRMGRPGVVGTMARTAVIAGTATAVSGGMQRRRAGRAQDDADQQAANQAAYESQRELDDMQRQMDQLQAQQAPAAAPAPAAGDDNLMDQLTKLADLKAAGVLTDAEFGAAKAKLLGA